MKNVFKNLKQYSSYLMALCLVVTLNSCSDDDDGIIEPFEPTGFFDVGESFVMTGNTITLESITVDQESWLVAVPFGEEGTNNFISDPVMLQEGLNTDIQLNLDENAIQNGDQIVLKIFGDDPNDGTMGQFDEADRDNAIAVTETITVFTEDSNEAAFSNLDTNGDGVVDMNELPTLFAGNFDEADIDNDGVLSQDEFFGTTFGFTDADDDDLVSEEEFGLGFDTTFNSFVANDFATFDADADGFLDANEWNTVFGDSDMFTTFDTDADSMIAETEFDQGFFDVWDTDDDDFIAQDEFNVFNPFVGVW